MGVRGLKTFVNGVPRVIDTNYRLHDTPVIIDSSNLMHELMRFHGPETRYGGDMVGFTEVIQEFYNNLKKCNIRPILVLDGADVLEHGEVSKFQTNLSRAREKFESALRYSQLGGSDVLFPTIAIIVFRSVSIELGIEIHQCISEADPHIARLAHENKCPIISRDTDFYLFDLPHGVITDFNHKDIHTISTNSKHYINCSMYNQKKFKEHLPNLDTRCLPLVAILSGNDFSSAQKFHAFCYQLPAKLVSPHSVSYSKQGVKLNRIFCFLKGKSLQENVDEICDAFPYYERNELRQLIKVNLKTYQIPKGDNFSIELAKFYRKGFYSANEELNKNELESKFMQVVDEMSDWFKNRSEKSLLDHKSFDMMYRNTIFIRTLIDDPQLPSANCCFYRYIRVMLTLLRSSRTLEADNASCRSFDRIKCSYDEIHSLRPLKDLEGFGPLDYIAYEVPLLNEEKRKKILLATFYMNEPDSDPEKGSRKAFEQSVLQQLFDYIDRVCESSGQPRLSKDFKLGVQHCFIYYHFSDESNLRRRIDEKNYTKMPSSSSFDCRIVHQISLLQMSITSFNYLNAVLGDVVQRMRPENWFNSCLIYNLVKALQGNTLQLS